MSEYSNSRSRKRLTAILILSLSAVTFIIIPSGILGAADDRGYIESRDIPTAAQKTTIVKEDNSANPYSPQEEKDLGVLQKQARMYRQDGLELQRLGNLDGAMAFYQKAVELDPSYAVAYNDLGVIYEVKGLLDRAEEFYLKSIQIDPDNLSAYSNLALFYENKRDLDKAAFYWRKRMELGQPGDPWTEKAKKRLNDLTEVMPELKQKRVEEEMAALAQKVAQEKQNRKSEQAKEAKKLLASAKKLEKKSEYRQAIDEIKKALSQDPQNKEALSMMEGIKVKLKKQEQAAAVQEMQLRFKTAVTYYQEDNPRSAREELDKIKELAK